MKIQGKIAKPGGPRPDRLQNPVVFDILQNPVVRVSLQNPVVMACLQNPVVRAPQTLRFASIMYVCGNGHTNFYF